jgi:protein phosphatase
MPSRSNLALRTQQAASGTFDVCGLTHRGMVRDHNEDCWMGDVHIGLALVADGVGGHGDGAFASKTAAKLISGYIRRVSDRALRRGTPAIPDAEAQEALLRRAIAFTHRRMIAGNGAVRQRSKRRGSTIVGLWAPGGSGAAATVFHVGDSRLYLLRKGKMQQMTRDHSAYEQWQTTGKVGAAPSKKYILQALGLSDQVVPTVQSFVPARGDSILICSDGLTGAVEDKELSTLLAADEDLTALCDRLIATGLARDASDNLTAVVCKFCT